MITKGTAPAGSSLLALHGEVQLSQIICIQLQDIQTLISVLATLLILRLESVGQPASTVLAGLPPAAGLGLALWG